MNTEKISLYVLYSDFCMRSSVMIPPHKKIPLFKKGEQNLSFMFYDISHNITIDLAMYYNTSA